MLIERLEFIGYGNLTGQAIDFAAGKVCIIVQPNDYGKSTMAESIWAVLYDYPADARTETMDHAVKRKPVSGAAFKACLDLAVNQRNVRLIRDFSERSLKVLDLSKDPSKADADITHEFLPSIAAHHLGETLTGLSRELFQRTCIIGSADLDSPPFVNDHAISALLLSVSEKGSSFNVFDAISAVEQKLANFPLRGRTVDCDSHAGYLAELREQLSLSLSRIESERKNCDRDVERLWEIEARLHARAKLVNADEYLQLCIELADVEVMLAKAHERLDRVKQLNEKLLHLSGFENFPHEKQKDIEQMWIRRQSRFEHLRRLESEVKEQELQLEIKDFENRERGERLDSFTVEDAQMLSGLASSLAQALAKLEDAKTSHETELMRVRSKGVDVDMLADIRRSLLSLDPKELDELHTVHAMAVGARDRSAEYLMSADKARTASVEIKQGRALLVSLVKRCFWPCVIMAALLLPPMMYLLLGEKRAFNDRLVSPLLLLWAVFMSAGAACVNMMARIAQSYRVKEEDEAGIQETRFQMLGQEEAQKAKALQRQIETLATKSQLGSGRELVSYMQEYAAFGAQLKELDFLEHVLKSERALAEKLRQEIYRYFLQARREVEHVSPKEAMRLAQDVNRFLSARDAFGGSDRADHRRSEIRFLRDALKDADAAISDELKKLGIQFNTIEEGYQQFSAALGHYRQWQLLNDELDRISDDSRAELPSELPHIIDRLDAKRADMSARMEEMVAADPEIGAIHPAHAESRISRFGKELSDLKSSVNELKRERDELTVQIRAAMKNYQDNYLDALEKLETVEQDLQYLLHTSASLKIARDTLLKLAQKTHMIFSDRLSDITRDLLRQVGSEYESLHFDADMRITVKRRGQRSPISVDDQSLIASGTRQQLYFVARIAVNMFLSHERRLPIILDEPFCAFDDDRFVKVMRTLINTVSQEHQVIILSCHQKRHDWFIEQLPAREKQKVEVCQLVPIKAGTAYAKR